MKQLFTILSICLLLAATSCTKSQSGLGTASPEAMGMNSARLSAADDVINESIARGEIPGAVLSVVRDNKIVYLKAYGNKSVVPDTVAMTTETVFDLASVSKSVGTALSFMQLVERGKVRLIDNVSRYIPGFEPWIDPVTGEKVEIEVRDLLTHSSGLPAYISMPAFVNKYGEDCPNSPDTLMKYIATELPRTFRPKTDFTYSCLNFVTLQNILQNVTGEKLCDYAQKNVFDALGLKHTCYKPTGENLDLCAPTEVQPDGKPLVGEVHDPIARVLNLGNSGNAGVFSNAEDLSVIAAALMNGGAINGRRILGDLTVKTMAEVPDYNLPFIGRALGWDNRSDYSGHKGDLFDPAHTICHTGYTGTEIVIDLENKVAVILLAHRVHPYDKGSVSRLRALVSNIVAGSIENK